MENEPSVVIEAPASEAEALAEVEIAEVEAEAVEVATDAAVQIAEIEANKEIILAEIDAETRLAEAEAYSEASANQDSSEWKRNIETRLEVITSQLETLTASQSTLLALEVQEQSQPAMNPSAESVEVMQVNPEAEAEQSAPEPPKRPKKSVWI